MSIQLLLTPRAQVTPMSCWWACMRMVLEYYGQRYIHPRYFRYAFRRPWNRPVTGWPNFRRPSTGNILRNDPELRRPNDLIILEPYEWYDRGVPNSRPALQLLSSITGFVGVPERPAFGHWQGEDVERNLRCCGPYIFLGFWHGAPHAIVITGYNESRNNVVLINPARGLTTELPLAQFNRLMGHFVIRGVRDLAGSSLNPIYLPQERPVREVIYNGH